jgi:hypothetical protein
MSAVMSVTVGVVEEEDEPPVDELPDEDSPELPLAPPPPQEEVKTAHPATRKCRRLEV